ncbi:hypothetical protein DNH61_14150 [Paenibacillus sambharensis]|uniref:DUF1835 domain-containing protein n=1 Tax=Paenibacillus sambharensis TaxID=1803190 RepID=A0A2W1L8T4_9BACL|nr:hypothetical protein [Paenibacillus sambharensis]PZD95656.1 hypothetical protein DNH61_14150 [Paenibacillus sambharensis]
MLHLTSTDQTAMLLGRAGLDGDVQVWREFMTEGPVRTAWYKPAVIEERASYIEETLGLPRKAFIQIASSQLKRLEEAAEARETIVLWFDGDLYDQTILAALLYWFRQRQASGMPIGSLEWIAPPYSWESQNREPFGIQEPKRLAELWSARRIVEENQLQFASEGWIGFSSEDPQWLEQWLARRAPGEPSRVMLDALRFHLRRFPSLRSGLGSVERETMLLLSIGPARPDELLTKIKRAYPLYGLGELAYDGYLRRMEAAGLIVIHYHHAYPGCRAVEPPDYDSRLITMTSYGARVLTGQADVLRDGRWPARWLGGIKVGGGSTKAWRCAGGDRDGGTSMIYL